MEIVRLQAKIDQLVMQMLVEGLLNIDFQLVLATRAAGDFQLAAKMILFFCTQIGKDLRAIANYLKTPDVDYAGAAVCAGHLGIRSCGIGAQSILYACRSFMQACVHRSKDECVGALYVLHDEYSRLLPKFLEILQIEKEILYLRQQH